MEKVNHLIPTPRDKITDKFVLLVISMGLVVILLSIIVGLFLSSRPGFTLPNWAENVFVSIATAAALKLGDCLSTLIALAGGRQVERLGNQLGMSQPFANGNGKPPDAPAGTPADPLTVVGSSSPEDPPLPTVDAPPEPESESATEGGSDWPLVPRDKPE